MNKEQYRAGITKIVFMMAEAFRDTASDALIDAWVAVLRHARVTIDEAQQAAVEVMSTRQYNKLPPPGVFLEILRPQVSHKALGESQADIVLEAIRGLGPMGGVKFEDPITDKLMATRWPWRSFSMELLSEQVKWWRKEFVAAYCEEKDRPDQPLLETPDLPELDKPHVAPDETPKDEALVTGIKGLALARAACIPKEE